MEMLNTHTTVGNSPTIGSRRQSHLKAPNSSDGENTFIWFLRRAAPQAPRPVTWWWRPDHDPPWDPGRTALTTQSCARRAPLKDGGHAVTRPFSRALTTST